MIGSGRVHRGLLLQARAQVMSSSGNDAHTTQDRVAPFIHVTVSYRGQSRSEFVLTCFQRDLFSEGGAGLADQSHHQDAAG